MKNRRLAYGDAIEPCERRHALKYTPNSLACALRKIVGFRLSGVVSSDHKDEDHLSVGYLISDIVLPFGKMRLSLKSKLKRLVDNNLEHPVEVDLVGMLFAKRVLATEIRDVIQLVGTEPGTRFNGLCHLNRATKFSRAMQFGPEAMFQFSFLTVSAVTGSKATIAESISVSLPIRTNNEFKNYVSSLGIRPEIMTNYQQRLQSDETNGCRRQGLRQARLR
jgi:hypothetical protein